MINPERNKAIEIVEEILDEFENAFRKHWLNGMYKKIGLLENGPDDFSLLEELLRLMKENESDYTLTFRYLSKILDNDNDNSDFTNQFKNDNRIVSWITQWKERVKRQKKSLETIKDSMLKVNPAYIPRNHRIEQAIYEATKDNNFSEMETLILLLKNPYTDQKNNIKYMNPPNQRKNDYQTFCGT